MKRILSIAFIATTFLTPTFASSSDLAAKLTKFHRVISSQTFDFEAKKSGDGYDVAIKPLVMPYKDLFKKDATIHIKVDEGPLITSPSFGFGKAGLQASGALADLLRSDIANDIKKTFKDGIKYKLTGKVSFGDDLREHIEVEPLEYKGKDSVVKVSKSSFDIKGNLDKIIPTTSGKIDYIKVLPNSKNEGFELNNFTFNSQATEPPLDGYIIFGKNHMEVEHFNFKAKAQNQFLNIDGKIKIDGDIKKVSNKLCNFHMKEEVSTDNKDTIALLKGVKRNLFELNLQNVGIDGLVGLIKLQKEQEQIQEELIKASKKNDDVAMQKAIVKLTDLNNKLVPIYNSFMISGKSRIIANLELESDKLSYIKVNLLYKAAPISGDISSAFILLAAQGLAIFDGDIEAKVDGTLANSINPMASLILGMLQSKGLITMKNGVYELKAKLKDGKVIINNKSYTLQELTAAILQ